MILAAADIAIASQVPAAIASWLECLVFILGAVYLAISLWRQIVGKPAHPPNELLESSQVDLSRRVGALEDGHNMLHTKIGSSERETRRQLDDKTGKLSAGITAVSLQVAGIAATNETQSQQLAVINSDIKKILVALPRPVGGHHD